MKKQVLSLCLAAMCLLSACERSQPDTDKRTIVATTYPVYLFASAVTEGVEGIEVLRLDTGSTSCLHDYNLTVNDMKKIEKAEVIAINGAGLEEFMEDALPTSDALVINCSEGVHLLDNESHHHDEHDHSHDGHDHGHFDPHYWMDMENAGIMLENIAAAMSELDTANAQTYRTNAMEQGLVIRAWDSQIEDSFRMVAETGVEIPGLITFHDGIRYFCHAYDQPLLETIEEEAGSEASAKEIVEITHLVKEHDIPVIFTEVNGSDATAKAIVRETDCAIAQLSMCMDGPDDNLNHYLNAMLGNMAAIVNGFAGEEVVTIQ